MRQNSPPLVRVASLVTLDEDVDLLVQFCLLFGLACLASSSEAKGSHLFDEVYAWFRGALPGRNKAVSEDLHRLVVREEPLQLSVSDGRKTQVIRH